MKMLADGSIFMLKIGVLFHFDLVDPAREFLAVKCERS